MFYSVYIPYKMYCRSKGKILVINSIIFGTVAFKGYELTESPLI